MPEGKCVGVQGVRENTVRWKNIEDDGEGFFISS